MSNNQNNKAIENFQKYLKIKTVHPNPDYVGCVKFLQEMAAEIGLKFEVVEVIRFYLFISVTFYFSSRVEFLW